MINASQLREFVIKPALIDLIMFSEPAVDLLMFTCAVESGGGTYLKQISGPALGIFQMEPTTYNDIWDNYIKQKNSLSLILSSTFGLLSMPDEQRMIYDLRYATIMARIHYERVPEPLPFSKDVDAIWDYYKKYYNCGGKALKENSLLKYKQFIT